MDQENAGRKQGEWVKTIAEGIDDQLYKSHYTVNNNCAADGEISMSLQKQDTTRSHWGELLNVSE